MDGLEEGRTAFCFCFRLAWITTLVVWEHWDCTISFLVLSCTSTTLIHEQKRCRPTTGHS
jgi:hypothetical protein